MKKIMFNEELDLTQSVLDGNKKQIRRICKYDRPSDEWEIGFPIFEANDFNDEGECRSPLNYAFGWRNKRTGEGKKWNIPKYKVGEVVAIAQSYKQCDKGQRNTKNKSYLEYLDSMLAQMTKLAGWNNKMFVRADLMPHQIKVTNIRIEKLQDISDEDCLKEGIIEHPYNGYMVNGIVYKTKDEFNGSLEIFSSPQGAYAKLIDKINGKGAWGRNPYVFVYEFDLIK